jgi:preprotein translocase subunit YajC
MPQDKNLTIAPLYFLPFYATLDNSVWGEFPGTLNITVYKEAIMKDFVLFLLMAGSQGQGGEGASGAGSGFMTFLPFIAIIAIFYFLIIRPQNKKQKETQKMLAALKKGDKVVTIGGVHGTIQSVRDQSVVVKVDDNTKIEFSRSAISSIVAAAKEDKEEKQEEDSSDEK